MDVRVWKRRRWWLMLLLVAGSGCCFGVSVRTFGPSPPAPLPGVPGRGEMMSEEEVVVVVGGGWCGGGDLRFEIRDL
jgi:hypothetical protein